MPDQEPPPPGQQQAAAYLYELLLRPGRYRRKWEQYSERGRHGRLNQLAVAETLAHYLWQHPRTSADRDVLPRQLKDTTSRALSGTLLSKQTLQLFMDAFDLPDFERDQLSKLWSGAVGIRFLHGPGSLKPELFAEVSAVIGPPGHQTVAMHDHMFIGPDRLPVRLRVLQVIEATRDGLDRIPFLFDTSALTVTTGLGCTGLAGQSSVRIGDEVYVNHLLLANALQAGDTMTIEYWVTYRYPDSYAGPDGREYRRVFMRGVRNFDIRIEFDGDDPPGHVWWAIWSTMQGDVVEEQEVTLDSQNAVQRFLSLAEKVVVGFHWEW